MNGNGKRDLYNRKRSLDNFLRKLKGSRTVSKTNKELIFKFHERCCADGLSVARISKYVYILRNLATMLKKDFVKAKKEDMVSLVGRIEKREDWAEWTKHDYKLSLKKFFRWLRNKEEDPEETRWIKLTMKNNNHTMPDEILTQEEVYEMVKHADTSRDKAMILVLYESGCRVGEVLNLQIKNVQFDDIGCILFVEGKTGQRRVRMVNGRGAAESLKVWMNDHPYKDDPEAYLWLSLSTNCQLEPMGHRGFSKMIKKIALMSGVKKRVNPHAFRHARATHLANQLTEAQMKEMFGWVQNSKMASVYVHLSGRDLDKALLDIYGRHEKEERREFVLNKLAALFDKDPGLMDVLAQKMKEKGIA